LKSGDLVTDSVSVWGTTYKVGHVVVTSVICPDILEVGIIEKVVVRGSQARFQVSLHDCARDSNNIFQSIPKNTGKLVPHSSLADFKPIFKRGTGKSFSSCCTTTYLSQILLHRKVKLFFILCLSKSVIL
jgi:hypothetical protein